MILVLWFWGRGLWIVERNTNFGLCHMLYSSQSWNFMKLNSQMDNMIPSSCMDRRWNLWSWFDSFTSGIFESFPTLLILNYVILSLFLRHVNDCKTQIIPMHSPNIKTTSILLQVSLKAIQGFFELEVSIFLFFLFLVE